MSILSGTTQNVSWREGEKYVNQNNLQNNGEFKFNVPPDPIPLLKIQDARQKRREKREGQKKGAMDKRRERRTRDKTEKDKREEGIEGQEIRDGQEKGEMDKK